MQRDTSIPDFSKKFIIGQALKNLGLDEQDELSSEEYAALIAELDKIVYAKGTLDDFITDTPSQPDEYESLSDVPADAEKYHRMARNILRYLLRGVSLCETNDKSVWRSPLFQREIIYTLFKKRDNQLFAAMRVEMQSLLDRVYARLESGALTPAQEKRSELFINTVLVLYPFIDPVDGDLLHVPLKINDEWHKVAYRFEQLDMSPTTGLLSLVIEDEDRIYAYGLVTENAAAPSLLLFMGTTFGAGQGAELAFEYNLYPGYSVGEGHDMTAVNGWMQRQQSVRTAGVSKGGTLAMLAAARYPDKIIQADCLNPAPLCGASLERMQPAWQAWNAAPENRKPCINVFVQAYDPVFYIGKGFLPGTNIYRIIPNQDKSACNFSFPPFPEIIAKGYEAHIHNYGGRDEAIYVQANTGRINQSRVREFFNDVKSVLDWVVFPFLYLRHFCLLAIRKVERFYAGHRLACRLTLIGAALITGCALMVAGLLFPPVAALLGVVLLTLGVSVSPVIFSVLTGAVTGALTAAASICTPVILEKASVIALKILDITAIALHAAVTVTVGLAVSALSGIKIGFKALYGKLFGGKNEEHKPPANNNMIDITTALLKEKPGPQKPAGMSGSIPVKHLPHLLANLSIFSNTNNGLVNSPQTNRAADNPRHDACELRLRRL